MARFWAWLAQEIGREVDERQVLKQAMKDKLIDCLDENYLDAIKPTMNKEKGGA